MKRNFLIAAVLAFFCASASVAFAQNYYTTDQILNQVFDEPAKKLNVNAAVSIGSLEVQIETPAEMSSNTVSIVAGATTEVSFAPSVKSILIQNFGGNDVKYITNRNAGTGRSALPAGTGVAFDQVISKIYIYGSGGTAEIQIDAWK